MSGCARWLGENPRSGVWVTKGDLGSPRFDLAPYDGVIYHSGVRTFERRLRRYRGPAINTSANTASIPPNSILSDDAAAARMAAEHFRERGRSELAVLYVKSFLYQQRRLIPFVEAVKRFGQAPITIELNDWNHQRSWKEAIGRIRAHAGALGVFTTDNQLGERVCRELTAAGVAVPEDVAVVGIGNETNLCEFATPPLSSVDIGIDLRGYRALEELVAQINGKPALTAPILIAPRGVIVRQSSDLSAVSDTDVRTALRFIHDHADEPVRIDEVVRVVNISRRSLEQKFAISLKRTIHEEIWRAHQQLAKHLLIHSDLPLYHIAARSGFGTLSNFSTLFRRASGVSPGEFRRKHREMT